MIIFLVHQQIVHLTSFQGEINGCCNGEMPLLPGLLELLLDKQANNSNMAKEIQLMRQFQQDFQRLEPNIQ